MVVPQVSDPEIAEGVVSVGIVFAVIAEDVWHVARDLVVETAKTMRRFVGKRDRDDLKQKRTAVREKSERRTINGVTY